MRSSLRLLQAFCACVLTLGAAATLLQGQATGPGSPLIEPTRIRFGTVEYTLTLVRGDEEEAIGIIRDELVPMRGNEPMLRRVQTLVRNNGILVDSSLTSLADLAPRWHHSIQGVREFELDMVGQRVLGTVTPSGGQMRGIDTTLSEGFFDATNWDLIVRALPLVDGESTWLSVYDVDNNLHRYLVRVIERQVRGKADVIHVIVEMGKNREVHAWFDDSTRVMLRMETRIGPDMVFRQVMKAQP